MEFIKRIANIFTSDNAEQTPVNIGRNDDCWCGSGRKYKKCHLEEDEKKIRSKYALNCGKT